MQCVVHQWAFPGSFEHLLAMPRQKIVNDWYGYDVDPPAEYCFVVDGAYLWYLAARRTGYMVHPGASPGAYCANLWKYDAAEWFMRAGDGLHYLEFNLAPNGAWWSCVFSEVRVPAEDNVPLAGVKVCSRREGNSWIAMAKIPLASLPGIEIQGAGLAAAFILNSPDQIFLSTMDELSGEPDFHRPSCFPIALLK